VVQQKSLKKNFIYNLISQIVTLIIPVITAPYISRVLQVEVIGQISYSLSIITYFMLAANLGFNIYGQRAIATMRDDKEKKSKVFFEITMAKLLLTIISLAVLYSILFTVGFGEKYKNYILIMSLQVVSVIFDIQFLYQGEEDFQALSIRTIAAKVVGLVLIFIFVKTIEDGWKYALLTSGITFASNIIMWPKAFKIVSFAKTDVKEIIKHIKPAFLIFLPTLAATIYSVFDKTMIGLLASNRDYANGCYDRAYTINSMALVLVTVLTAVMMPRNAHEHAMGNEQAVKNHLNFASRYIWMMGTPLIVGFAVLSKNLSISYLGPGYDDVPFLMQIMSIRFLVSGFGDMLGSQLFIAIGKEKYPTIATFVGACVNLTMNYFLIQSHGAMGAAIATVVCEIIVTAILIGLAIKKGYFNMKEMVLKSWRYIVAAGIMFVPIYFLEKVFEYNIFTFLLITLVGAMVYFMCLFILRDDFLINNVKNMLTTLKAKLKSLKRNKENYDEEVNNEN